MRTPRKPQKRRMRVVVDGMSLVRDSAYRGIGTYARHIVQGLSEISDFEVVVLAPLGSSIQTGTDVRRVLRAAPGRWAAAEHDLLLPFDLARVKGAVFFGPGQWPPRRSPYPVVQTVHDVASIDTPPQGASSVWSTARWGRVHTVVAISDFAAHEAIERLSVPADRVVVIPHGRDPAFAPAADRSEPAQPFLLMVGEYDPRKRHHLAFEVVGRLASEFPHRLVVAGRVAPWYAGSMQELVGAAPRPDRVELAGYVAKEDLVRLYQDASAVIITSAAEGFGFPALEAMASGTPVVAFANSATIGVVGDAGLLIADGDVRAMVDACRRVLLDQSLRARLVQAGLDRAAAYSWKRSVDTHAEVICAAATAKTGSGAA